MTDSFCTLSICIHVSKNVFTRDISSYICANIKYLQIIYCTLYYTYLPIYFFLKINEIKYSCSVKYA